MHFRWRIWRGGVSSLSYLHVPQAQALSYLRSPQTRTFFLPLLLLPLLIPAPAFAALPDNRAYELVSPIEKGGVSNLANLVVTDAAGEHVIVDGGSKNAALASAASWMLETRTPTGWSGAQIGPAPTPEATFVEQTQVSLNSVSEDFSRFAFQSRMAHDPRDNTQGMGEYLREGVGGPFVWATGPPAPAVPVSEPGECENGITVSGECTTNKAVFAGASKDLRDLVWGEYHPLLEPPAALPGYPADTHQQGYEVYESVAGADELVGLVPGGSEVECGPSSGRCAVPPCGAAMGNEGGEYVTFTPEFAITPGFAPVAGAVSGDGDQVVFTSPDPVPYKEPETACTPPEIYIRVNGTTTVRVLESVAAQNSGKLNAGAGRTRIFIYPPFDFKIVDAMLTNFHLPCSTLLMLVSAFAAPDETRGREMVLSAYAEAICERYRFFSYGDAMLIL